MHTIVTIKQVPDPDIPPSHFKIDEANNWVIPPSGVAPVMNGYDANALEAALRLKEQHGGDVTVVSVGAPEARDTLKRALAMGATRAILVSDPVFENLDSLATARVLAAAIKKVGDFDLVLSGRQASDSDAGQVPLGISEFLGIPSVSPIGSVEQIDGGFKVERIAEEGRQVIAIDSPCLLGVSSEIGEPRYPPLRGIMAAGRAEIPVWGAADLGIDTEKVSPRRRMRRLYQETREGRVELIEADSPSDAGEQLALKLRDAKLI
jgi:electron transfer flavoprotein beta subunit